MLGNPFASTVKTHIYQDGNKKQVCGCLDRYINVYKSIFIKRNLVPFLLLTYLAKSSWSFLSLHLFCFCLKQSCSESPEEYRIICWNHEGSSVLQELPSNDLQMDVGISGEFWLYCVLNIQFNK